MKKMFFAPLALFCLAAILFSCKKDTTPDGEKFSTLSVEANKAVVENAGIDFANAMDRMRILETVDVLVNLGDIMSSAGAKGFLFSKETKLFSTLSTLTATSKGEKKINDLFGSMVASKELSEDPESIKQFWDENVGTYTWNPSLNDWDIELGGNKVIALFPSTETGTTNDATLTISNYAGVNISNPIEEDYTGDLPVSLNADLKVGSKTLITFIFGASYNTDGVPNAIAADLTIENFKFEVDIANTTTVVSVNYKFLENDAVIMDLGASGEGLFTEANYNASTITHTETNTYIVDYILNSNTQQWDPVYETYTDEWDETEFEEILNSASAHFQLYDVVLRGDINVKGLVDQIRLIDADLENETIDRETADNNYAAKINEFLNLRLVDATNNLVMAKAEAYVVKEIYDQYVDTYIDFRLTFNDGSPIDVETYFNAGFDDFINELNGMIYDINTEYELDIEPIDY